MYCNMYTNTQGWQTCSPGTIIGLTEGPTQKFLLQNTCFVCRRDIKLRTRNFLHLKQEKKEEFFCIEVIMRSH